MLEDESLSAPDSDTVFWWGVGLVSLHLLMAATASASVLISRRTRPVSALSWIFALVAIPVVTPFLWWAMGRTRFERRLRRHQAAKRRVSTRAFSRDSDRHTAFDRLIPLAARVDNTYSSSGNRAELLIDGARAFPQLMQDISRARRSVRLFFYEFEFDELGKELCEVLIERAKSGVEVCLLLDGFGAQSSQRRLKKVLRPHGVRVEVFLENRFRPWFAPRLNFVNHRKSVVLDGEVGFLGGMNVASHYRDSWRDLMLRVNGPVVEGLHQTFLEDWFFTTNEELTDEQQQDGGTRGRGCSATLLTSGPDSDMWIHDVYLSAIIRAERRVLIVTPYLLPTSALLAAIRVTAGRGVQVDVIVPQKSDVGLVNWASNSYYRELLESGVNVHEYTPGMLHAKALLIDDYCALGSANLDRRSMRLNFELTCFLDDAKLVRQLEDWSEELIASSQAVTLLALDHKSQRERLMDSAAHLLSPLL